MLHDSSDPHANRAPRARRSVRLRFACRVASVMGVAIAALTAIAITAQPTYAASAASTPQSPQHQQFQAWIADMKTKRRGPFDAIRWFCADGQVLEPEPYACSEFGGGVQHGRWSEQTQAIRDAGFPIANVLIEVDPADVTGSRDKLDQLRMILLEQWLVRFDDGWILRRARSYRGAFQVENERFAALEIVRALLADDKTVRDDFFTVREAVRLLPIAGSDATVDQVRSQSSEIADADAAFVAIRNRIHVSPSAADAAAVRDYAETAAAEQKADALALAELIDTVYGENALVDTVRDLRENPVAGIRVELPPAAVLASDQPDRTRLTAAAEFLRRMRPAVEQAKGADDRLRLLRASIAAESTVYTLGQSVLAQTNRTRADWLDVIESTLVAAYGAGLLEPRELQEQTRELRRHGDTMTAEAYRSLLRGQERTSLWATRRVRFAFAAALEQFSKIEPLVVEYPIDRLRGSPVFVNARALELLSNDAAELLGVRHELFGESVSGQLDVLNAGAATGVLMTDLDAATQATQPVIVLVPETTPTLPPVAGILTAEAGNALSHVQLLAASLGVPNVVVGEAHLDAVQDLVGQPVRLLASPGGVVQLTRASEADLRRDADSPEARKTQLTLPVDKLQLDQRRAVSVADLSSADSGRTVGPKAAKLGDLMDQFPGYISAGVGIPFGTYRALLDTPIPPQENDGRRQTRFEWMQEQYPRLATLRRDNPAGYLVARNRFLKDMREFFMTVPLPEGFEADLKRQMRETFGPDGSYGVFVRSDTNVEDLPNFTGAGLNLTVPHVVGEQNIIKAIREVWASPFTERAFGWRQALVDQPEHVYAAVLLHKSVPAVVSGVMVTSRDGVEPIRVVVNEGVGGGVEGDTAESVLIDPRNGGVTLLGTATAPRRTVLLPGGGIVKQPTSGSTQLLTPRRLEALRELALAAPQNFDLGGHAADIEFGFYGGTSGRADSHQDTREGSGHDKLWLFQIRPFVTQDAAKEAAALDAQLTQRGRQVVDMSAATGASL